MSDTAPWADYEPDWSAEAIQLMADDMEMSAEELRQSLQKDAWLDEQDLQTVVDVAMPDDVSLIYNTRYGHNRHLWTGHTAMPADITLESGIDAQIEWLLDIKRTIDAYTDWRVTNKRMVENDDGEDELVLTLAPED